MEDNQMGGESGVGEELPVNSPNGIRVGWYCLVGVDDGWRGL